MRVMIDFPGGFLLKAAMHRSAYERVPFIQNNQASLGRLASACVGNVATHLSTHKTLNCKNASCTGGVSLHTQIAVHFESFAFLYMCRV